MSYQQRIQKRLNCSLPSLSQSLLTRFPLRPSSSNWLVAESRGWVPTHSKQKLSCRPLKQTERNTSLQEWVGRIQGAEGDGCHCQSDFLSSLTGCGSQGDPWWWGKERCHSQSRRARRRIQETTGLLSYYLFIAAQQKVNSKFNQTSFAFQELKLNQCFL